MTLLFILGGIILLLFLLMLVPVRVRLAYKDGVFGGSVHYLFVRYDFSPEAMAKRAAKGTAKAVKREDKKQTQEADTKLDKTKGATDTAKTAWSLLKASRKGLARIRKGLVIYKLRIYLRITGDDAQKTATTYAQVSAGLSALITVLGELFTVKRPVVAVMPDFVGEKTLCDASVRLRIRPISVVSGAVSIGLGFVKIMRENKKARQQTKQRKGGQVHESATSYQ